MQRIVARPDALDLDSPGRRDYWLALENDTLWADHLIPLTVLVGPEAEAGRGLVAFGGNHGNEYEGPVVVRNLLSEIDIENVRGRIILVPVLNPPAFKVGIRESPADRVNLNRAFVDGAGMKPGLSGISHRIARFVREFIWPRVHVVIDLHAGGAAIRFSGTAGYHPIPDPEQNRQIEQAARWFGTPMVIIYQDATPGLLPSDAERAGKITIGCELGWGEAVHRRGVRWGRHGVLAAAIHHNQLRGEIEPIDHHADGSQIKVEMVDRECFIVAPFEGHYEPLTDCGDRVRKGDVVGRVHDFDRIDLPPWEARAALDGVVVAQAYRAPIPQGLWTAVVGKVID